MSMNVELTKALKDYIQLLEDECRLLNRLVHVYSEKSIKFKEGVSIRNRIKILEEN